MSGWDHLLNCHGWNLRSISVWEAKVKDATSGLVLRDSGPKSDHCNFEIRPKHSEKGSDRHDKEVWDGLQEWQMLTLSSVCAFDTMSHPPGAQLNL